VPFPEFMYSYDLHDQILSLSNMSDPRVLGTHVPLPSLPESITKSNCKMKSESLPDLTLEEAFEKYCNGIMGFGPWWSHVLGYWKESLTRPDKVLFLKYEDLKEDTVFHVKRIADFLDSPITQGGESTTVIENIIQLCGFEKMKDLEVKAN